MRGCEIGTANVVNAIASDHGQRRLANHRTPDMRAA
jgi:hypothetical protein